MEGFELKFELLIGLKLNLELFFDISSNLTGSFAYTKNEVKPRIMYHYALKTGVRFEHWSLMAFNKNY